MKRNLVFIFLILGFFGCRENSDAPTSAPDAAQGPPVAANNQSTEHGCYLKVEGTLNQDTAWVQLKITGDTVSGSYAVLPYEKDSRMGSLKGTKKGNRIEATWTYLQEGHLDSLPVLFELSGDVLLQKPFSYHQTTGREYLADTTAFSVRYRKEGCPTLPLLGNAE